MAINKTDYIIYGWKLPYMVKDMNGEELDLWDDKFLPYIEGHKNIQYSIFNNFRWDE